MCVTGTHSSNEKYSNVQKLTQIKIPLTSKLRQINETGSSQDTPYPHYNMGRQNRTMPHYETRHYHSTWEGPLKI